MRGEKFKYELEINDLYGIDPENNETKSLRSEHGEILSCVELPLRRSRSIFELEKIKSD